MCVFALVELLVASSPQAGSEEVETSCWAPEEAVLKRGQSVCSEEADECSTGLACLTE